MRRNVLATQCGEAGCPERTWYGGRCPAHGGGWQGTRPMPPGWSRLRRQVLREQPTCSCGEPSTEVDHILARSLGGDPIDRRNLQALCSIHHREKTNRDRAQAMRLKRRGAGR